MDPKTDTVNNGFWDRPPEERAAMKEAACLREGVANFFDLEPEQRSRVYDDSFGSEHGWD